MGDTCRQRSRYSETFKQETVERYRTSGLAVNAFAREVGIEQSILHRWIKRYDLHDASSRCSDAAQGCAQCIEVSVLRSEVHALRCSVETLRGIVEKSLIKRYFPEIAPGLDDGSHARMRRVM